MAFDGITLYSVVNEMQILNGAKVNSIFQPDKNNIIISVYNGNNYAINIDTTASNYRINLTTQTKKNPLNALSFCMSLRKQLNRAKIESIYMKNLERICYIKFSTYNEMNDIVNKILIIELMGKYSNVILANDKFIIIDALKKFDNFYIENQEKNEINESKNQEKNNFKKSIEDNKYSEKSRSIMPGRKYVEPIDEKNNFIKIDENSFIEIVENSNYKTLDTAIPNLFTGISKIFIQNIIKNLEITNTISKKSLKYIYNYINEVIDKNNAKNLVLYINKNNYSIALNKIVNKNLDESDSENYTGSLNINFALDDFYSKKYDEEIFKNYRNSLLKILDNTLDKLTKKLYNINEKIELCKNKDLNKLYGELLIANAYRLNNNFSEVQVENYYENNNIVNIKINPKLTIPQNAQEYFKKYDKMKRTIEICNKQKEQTNKELNYLGTIIYELDSCTTISDIDAVYEEISENILFNEVTSKRNIKSKKEENSMLLNYLKFRVDDFDVLVGKNNKQNDYITFKVANDTDYWFHTKDIHGSHLILRNNGITPKIETIKRCAEIVAYHSKAKFSSHVPVDYTQVKNVKKPKGAAPGYVIYKNNKTIYVTPQI